MPDVSANEPSTPWGDLRVTMNRLLQAYCCQDNSVARRMLRHWYNTDPGNELAAAELDLMGEVLPDLFGYHLLQIGEPSEHDLLASTRIGHCMILNDLEPPVAGEERAHSRLLGSGERLPLASASLDVVVLPHTLEYADHPHEVLREVERVVIPEGHVVILGFNPWSLFGLGRLLIGWRQGVPWSGHFYSAMRVRDWLKLLGFDTLMMRRYFFQPPLRSGRLLLVLLRLERFFRRWWPLPGGCYILLAKRRGIALTPIRPRRRRRRVVAVGAAEPTA